MASERSRAPGKGRMVASKRSRVPGTGRRVANELSMLPAPGRCVVSERSRVAGTGKGWQVKGPLCQGHEEGLKCKVKGARDRKNGGK